MSVSSACIGREQIFAYAHHMLSSDEAARVERHLAICGACREAAAGFARLDAVLAEWKPVEPSPWFDARARARIAAAPRPWRYLPRLNWQGWSAIAAAAVVAIVLGVAALRPAHSDRGVRNAQTEIASAQAETKPAAASPVSTPVAPLAPSQELARSEAANASPQPATAADSGTTTVAQAAPASQEIDLYKNLNVLENYDMLANFDVLSELPQNSGASSD